MSFKNFRPFGLYLFLSLAAGIWAGSRIHPGLLLPDPFHLFLISRAAFSVIFSAALLLCLFRRWNALVPVLILAVFFWGLISIQHRIHPEFPDNHVIHYAGDTRWGITGTVVSFTRHEKYRSRIVLAVSSIKSKETGIINVCGNIYLNIYGREKSPAFGSQVGAVSRIRGIRNFQNPGGFDYRRHLQFQDIYGSAWTTAEKLILDSPEPVSEITDSGETGRSTVRSYLYTAARQIESVRTGFYHFVSEQTGERDTGKILVSLVTGKKEVLPLYLRDLFSKAGISHLLAISGLHLGMVAAFFVWVFYRLFSLNPRWLVSGRAKKAAGITAVLPIFLYAVLTGFSDATQRALIMVVFVIAAYASERSRDVLLNICYAGVLILLMDCTALFAISFQLSFAAVIVIAAGFHLITMHGWKIENQWGAKAAMILCVTFLAGIATAPLTAFYFNVVSTISLAANFFMVPLFGMVILPLGLLAMACFSFSEGLAGFLVSVADILIQSAVKFCEILTQIPWSAFRVSTPSTAGITGVYLFLIFIFFFIKMKKKKWLIPAGVCLVILGAGWVQARLSVPAGIQITALDVGQGNCTHIHTPAGKHILVDGGGFSGRTTFDTGRHIVAPYLWKHHVTRLDYVILTHPESDHLRGLVYILENFPVGVLIKNTDVSDSWGYQRLMQTCEKKGIPVHHPRSGEEMLPGSGIHTVFFDPEINADKAGSLNAASLVFQLRYADFSMLFAGDILAERENRLCRNFGAHLDSTVLLAPHHGSATSSSKLFLEKILPESIIVSCGWKNRYGFPHGEVLDRYRDLGASVFRTDLDGAVLIRSNGVTYDILTGKGI